MNYSEQKTYFERAYRTGSDFWTMHSHTIQARDLLRYIPSGSMLLDLGSGRGRFPLELSRFGYKVIGLEYVKKVVTANNKEVQQNGMTANIRFVEGDALDIPFTDTSFDGVIDFGLIQHFTHPERKQCMTEVNRVLKPGGYVLMTLLSRETTSFLTWTPKADKAGDFENEGIYYHFFTPEEIMELYGTDYALISKRIEYIESHPGLAYLVILLRKK